MRVVVAPDSFKGTLSAREAAEAFASGWRAVRPRDGVVLRPMADGGEGTLTALVAASPGAVLHRCSVPGPTGRAVAAAWALLPDGTAVVELAAASGITLLDAPAPRTASTRGFGALIAAALDGGADALLLAVGGSASTDGGSGALRSLGARFLDGDGCELPDGGGALHRLARVELTGLRALPPRGAQVLTDVTNPLLGPRGAAAVYGPQKGATEPDVVLLERGLGALAGLLPADPGVAGSGAAGGAAFGLLAWGAVLVPGAPAVAAAAGLPGAIAGADLVITGEGRFDAQSAQGKVPAHVAALAAAAGVPALLVAGDVTAPTPAFAGAVSLTALVGRDRALADPASALHAAAEHLATRLP